MANVIISGALYNKLITAERLYNDIRYALRKDETLDESISCVRDIPSEVEMIEDLKKRAAESDYYKEKSELLEKRNNNQFDTIREKDKKIGELQNIVTEKEVEIKYLRKDNVRLNKDISWGNMIAEKNTELNQTISDQGVTIKALLITIKEMCKDDETNE